MRTAPVFFLLAVACGRPEGEVSLASAKQAIVNGTADTTHTSVIALISIDNLTSPHFGETCSGTVVAIDGGVANVLTAAHCLEKQDAGWTMLAMPADDYSEFLDAGLRVRNIVIHPFYAHGNGSYVDDFAMVSFDAPAGLTATPVLPAALDDLQVGTNVTLVGFGFTSHNGPDVNTGRREITKPIWQLTETQIAMDQSGGKGGQCQGDSGGAVLYTRDGKDYVAGVVSFGDLQCATTGVSGRTSAVEQGFVRQYVLGLPPSMEMTCGDCQGHAVVSGGACAAVFTTCSNNADCGKLNDCESQCDVSDTVCVQACTDATPGGVSPLQALNDCLCGPTCAGSCSAECAGPMPADAGSPDAGPDVVPDAGPSQTSDAGTNDNPMHGGGCTQAPGALVVGCAALLALVRRRRRP